MVNPPNPISQKGQYGAKKFFNQKDEEPKTKKPKKKKEKRK